MKAVFYILHKSDGYYVVKEICRDYMVGLIDNLLSMSDDVYEYGVYETVEQYEASYITVCNDLCEAGKSLQGWKTGYGLNGRC